MAPPRETFDEGKARSTRRRFLQASAVAGGSALLGASSAAIEDRSLSAALSAALPDLDPARWIWYPSVRCLANTFVLFRRTLRLEAKPVRARGWVAADSRYLLAVNGRRIQWGPAPSDPRWLEADPVDLSEALDRGQNVLGATVLHYGHGDGTWPMGKPGFLFVLDLECEGSPPRRIVSNSEWLAHYSRAWKPGQYKRWYLRALQEEFDARLYPHGWLERDFVPGEDWLPALELDCPSGLPPSASSYWDYALDATADRRVSRLLPRSVPLLVESLVPAKRLAEMGWIRWKRPAEEYFECLVPNAFEVDRGPCAVEEEPGTWKIELDGKRTAALTFEFEEQIVGWPRFEVTAPEGTIVELLVQEAHAVGGPPLLNTHFNAWARFTAREGRNEFECFDFESCRWVQLLVRGTRGTVRIREVGVRRRLYPWPRVPVARTGEPALDRLFSATVNTLHNCAQETCVDGMGRERQQYSGDGGHQIHAIHLAFGETRLPARYLRTFSQGITPDGYFLDCWPAYDRLARLMERPLQMTGWGPLLDHGVGFVFDAYHHYMYTGDRASLLEPYPRILRFLRYLATHREPSGLLPVEGLGIPSVWIDHVAYTRARHKQCAFNLYVAAMLLRAAAGLAEALDRAEDARAARELGRGILESAVKAFWSPADRVFVNNLPWLGEEKETRLCDRSLATAVLFDQCPGGDRAAAIEALVSLPPRLGFSYPCNAGWRLWALGKAGRADVILRELRGRWATMDSVRLNHTIQEDWTAAPDSGSQWSHCAVAPLYVLHSCIFGLTPLAPGFARAELRPRLGDLAGLEVAAHTVRGTFTLRSSGPQRDRDVVLEVPPGVEAELVLPESERLAMGGLERLGPAGYPGELRFRLPAGETRLRSDSL